MMMAGGTDRGRTHPLRVGLVAADPLRVLGFQALFENNPQVKIVAAAEIADVLRDKTLDIVLLGAPPNQLFELIASLRGFRPELRIIVMGSSGDQEYIRRVIGAGARGYLQDSAAESEILMALQEVFDGSVWAPRRVLSRLIDQANLPERREPPPAHGRFTARELEVLELLVHGASNREIGKALNIEERTVKSHLASLMRKVGVQNRIALTMHALNQDVMHKKDAS